MSQLDVLNTTFVVRLIAWLYYAVSPIVEILEDCSTLSYSSQD